MPNLPVKISELAAGDDVEGTEQLEVTQAAASRRLTATEIAAAPVAINQQTANYTLVRADGGRVVVLDAAAANDLTVPSEASVDWPIGTMIHVVSADAATTLVEDTDVTIIVPTGLTLTLPGGGTEASLLYTAPDEWRAVGQFVEDTP